MHLYCFYQFNNIKSLNNCLFSDWRKQISVWNPTSRTYYNHFWITIILSSCTCSVPNSIKRNVVHFQSLYGRINVEAKTYMDKKNKINILCIIWISNQDSGRHDLFLFALYPHCCDIATTNVRVIIYVFLTLSICIKKRACLYA